MAMSLWVNDKRSGRLWAIDVDIMAVMAVVAVVAAMLAPAIVGNPLGAARTALWLMVAGATLVAAAKATLLRQGIWLSWGTSRMSRTFAIVYRCGYSCMVLGLLMLILSLTVVRAG
jgi:hypothetical protein